MAHKDGIITAPIDVLGDVATVLGVNSGDVATLCMSGNINKFALYCPRYSSDNPGLVLDKAGFETIAGQVSQRPDSTYECHAYGVWIPKLDIPNLTPAKYSNLLTPARNTWYIARPTATTWKNIAHFDGYDHFKKPVKPMYSAVVTVTNQTAVTLSVMFMTPAPDGRIMSVSNLFGESGAWYFGFIAFRGTGTSEGISSNDIAFIASSTVNIVQKGSINAINVNVSCTDTIEKGKEYIYRIIPFVCNKRGLNSSTKNGGTLSGVSEGKFYGLRIVDKVGNVEWESLKTLSVGSTEGDVLSFFNFKDGNSQSKPGVGSYHYPDPAGTSCSYLEGPFMLIAYGEHYRGEKLLDKYYQIDFDFSGYPGTVGATSIHKYVTWKRENGVESITSETGDTLGLVRDKAYDNKGGYEDRLFFYSTSRAMSKFMNDAMIDNGFIDLNAQLHYTDEKGNAAVDSVWATWIPDLTTES